MVRVFLDTKDLNSQAGKLGVELSRLAFPDLFKAYRKWAGDLMAEMVQDTSGQPLAKRTGELSRSWRIGVGGNNLANLFAEVWSVSKYAVTHQVGMTIRPKHAKYLTIPIDKTNALVARGAARVLTYGKKVFFRRSKRGSLIMFQANKDGGLKPLFVLVKEVTIPKRLNFFEKAATLAEKMIRGLG